MKDRSFLDHILEDVLQGDSRLRAKAMFGGYGVYFDGAIFAIFDDGAFFFKVDADSLPDFEARDSQPFSYPKKDGTLAYMKKYWSLPEEISEDREELWRWIKRSAAISK
jgi:DNA transformation protein